MKVCQTIICLLATLLIAAPAAKAEDPVRFADPVLEAAVETQLGVTDPKPSDMLALTSLSASYLGIADLTGLEYATNLRSASLYGNRITDVNALKHLTQLTELDLSGNQITDIKPLAGLTHLRFLGFYENHYIADITPLAGLTELTYLSLEGNQEISDLGPLANLKNLTYLNLVKNKIVDINVLSGLTNLKQLDLSVNQISDIAPLIGLTGLTMLGLRDNPLDDADMPVLAGMTELTTLGLGNYYFGDDVPRMRLTDVSVLVNMPKLASLSLYCETLEDITPLAGLTEMTELFLGGNRLDNILPVAGMKRLSSFTLWDSQVSDLSPLANCTKLTHLYLVGNQIADLSPLAGLVNLRHLVLQGNHINDLGPLSGLTNLTLLWVCDNYLTDIRPLGGLTNLTDLRLDNYAYYQAPWNRIVDIAVLAGLVNLERLWLQGNLVDDIGALTALTNLQELRLNGNPLHPKACVIDIPLIRANNPGVVIHYDGCVELPRMLTVSSTPGGAVVMPGEDVFTYPWGELAPVEAVADEGYQFTHWTGTAVDPNVMLDPCAPHTSVFMDADYSLVAHFKPQDEPWSTVYFNDFEDQVGTEWSRNSVDATPVGARRFLGQFCNDAVTLALASLPAHSDVRVSFDLFIIRSWDGDLVPGIAADQGPDLWSLRVQDGPTLLQTTFDNHITYPYLGFHRQSYPHEHPYGESLPQTGAAEMSSLGYVWKFVHGPTPTDSTYHLSFTIKDSSTSIRFDFAALGLKSITDESWGLDNVHVEVLAAVSDATLTVSSTTGGAVTTPGEGQFKYPPGTAVPVQAVAEAGYHFTHWSGSAVEANKVADPASASTTVVVDGDYALVANFAVNQKTLTVSSGAGGSVTAPGEGSFQYPQGASVAVQAVANAHYYFTHWSGTGVDAGKVADPASASTTVTVDADYTLVANFKIDQHRLTVSAAAGGYIYVETRTGNVTTPWYDQPIPPLDHGTEVTVIATPYGGWKFTGWGGTMGSTESPFTFDLTQDCDLEALFVPE